MVVRATLAAGAAGVMPTGHQPTHQMKALTLPAPKIKTINNVTTVGPYNAGNGDPHTAARLGYLHGAEAMAEMFQEAYADPDPSAMPRLLNAVGTYSFFGRTT